MSKEIDDLLGEGGQIESINKILVKNGLRAESVHQE